MCSSDADSTARGPASTPEATVSAEERHHSPPGRGHKGESFLAYTYGLVRVTTKTGQTLGTGRPSHKDFGQARGKF